MAHFGVLHFFASAFINSKLPLTSGVYKCNTPRSHGLYITYITHAHVTTTAYIYISLVPMLYICSSCNLGTSDMYIYVVVVTWARVICLKYTHEHEDAARVQVHIFQANHKCPCIPLG